MRFVEKLRKWCGIESVATPSTAEVIKELPKDNKGDIDFHIFIPLSAIGGVIAVVIFLLYNCTNCLTCGGCDSCMSCCGSCVETCGRCF